ncbi:MAG: hypothetical protein WCI48_05825 [Bacteroidota bacterium]|jgi:hypothetical protein
MRKRRFQTRIIKQFMPGTRYTIGFSFFILGMIILTSCEKFKGSQEVPAYLKIDSIYITTDYSTQGSASHNITDAWVYVDGQLIGAFEMPCKFPVLQSGIHKVAVMAGIKVNGISSTRAAYNFYTPINLNVKFGIDSVTSLNTIHTTYSTSANFLWREDFEGTSISLDTTNRSTVPVKTTAEGSPLTIEGIHSAIMLTDSTNDFVEVQSHVNFPIPLSEVYLELNYNINTILTVGVILTGYSSYLQMPVVNLNVTNGKVKKIYIDLTPALNATTGIDHFRVYFGGFKAAGVKQGIMVLDNVKLITSK